MPRRRRTAAPTRSTRAPSCATRPTASRGGHTIDCSVGAERATTDRIDTVSSCETNETSGGGGGGGGGAELTVVTKRSIRRIARRGLKIKVSCPARCTIKARLLTSKSLARKLKLGRSRRLASARKTLPSAGTATLTLEVAKKARKQLRRVKQATGTLRVTRTGASTLTRRLRLKR